MTENTVEVTNESFAEIVLGSKIPVLVDFWAAWCGPCRMLAPTVEELADEMDGKVLVCKLNVDENMELATAYGVSSIPTLICFRDGAETNRLIGLQQKPEILRALGL